MSACNLNGPCGPVYEQIQEQEDILRQCLDEFPIGSTSDPRAVASDVTLTELAQARDLLRQANELIDRAIDREAKYSADNGWTLPGDEGEPRERQLH